MRWSARDMFGDVGVRASYTQEKSDGRPVVEVSGPCTALPSQTLGVYRVGCVFLLQLACGDGGGGCSS